MRRFLLLLSTSAAALLLLSGCSNNPSPAPLHTKRKDGSPWLVQYSNIGDNPRSLDPQVSYDTTGNLVISTIYESLLQYNLFENDPYQLEPCLAEEMPREVTNADGSLAYEVKIKRGIRFHDSPAFPEGKGRELTAHDFAYAFQRIADPKVECPVLSVMQEFIVGLKEAYEAAQASGSFDYEKPLAAVTVVDDYTFRINLLKPYPQLEYWLAMPFTSPVPREAVEYYDGKEGREQFKFRPVGTGPFQMAEWSRGRLIRLERNPHYIATTFPTSGWPEDREEFFAPLAGKPLPLLDEVQFAMIRESVASWLLFRQGYLDRAGVGRDNFNTVLTSTLTLSEEFEKRGVQLFKDVELTTYYSQFNMEDPVIGKNVKLRQALSMVYNNPLANEIFRNGIDINAQQILPPGIPGHQPDFKNPYLQHDVEKAKALMEEAGYPEGRDPATERPLELKLDIIAGSSIARQRAEFDKSQFEQLGIRVEMVENTWPRFQDRQIRGLFQMNTGSGWHADYPDAETFFLLFYSKNIPPTGHNAVRFQNAEFDRLFEAMAPLPNSPERLEIIHRMNAILVEECPLILHGHPVTFSLNQPWIPRISNNGLLAGGPGLKYNTLDHALREQKRLEWNQTPWWPSALLAAVIIGIAGYAIAQARKQNL